MRRLRTLVIHPVLAPYRVDLFNHLAERLDLDLRFQRGDFNYHRAIDPQALGRELRCPSGVLPGNRVVFDRDVPLGLARFIRERAPEVVVTSEFSGLSLAVGRAQTRSGARFGHVIWSDENLAMFRGHGWVRRSLRRLCLRRADTLVMCTERIADLFARRYRFPRERIRCCAVHQAPESVRGRLGAAGEAGEGLLDELGVRGRKVVLYVGRLAPEKNLAMALTAFARAFVSGGDEVFVFVGSGPLRAELEREAARIGLVGRVIFAGHRAGIGLAGCYRLASLLVLPSAYEPYGAVVNEALLSGVPVLCSSEAGAAHLVREGINGERIDPADPASLERALAARRPTLKTADALWRSERTNLMPVAFEEDVAGFVAAVEIAATCAGRRPAEVARERVPL
ncbi:MAG: glycosyltransferase [Opitutaceae bacterium]